MIGPLRSVWKSSAFENTLILPQRSRTAMRLPIFDLIKIDAEGSEILILRGGRKTLPSGKVQRIICEVESSKPDKIDEVRSPFFVLMDTGVIFSTPGFP